MTAARPKAKESQTIQLMHAVGARIFTPLPRWQHQWQFGKGEPMLHQMWSYLVSHTFASAVGDDGSAWAMTFDREGNPIDIHIEDMAAALNWDLGNTRKTWREGVERGIWRNGARPGSGECWPRTKWKIPEGKRRLILCGHGTPKSADKLAEGEEPQPEDWTKKVCTDLFAPYILKKIQELDSEQRADLAKQYLALDKAEDSAIAEAVASIRSIFDSEKDNTLSSFGLKKIHATRNGSNGTNGNGHAQVVSIEPPKPKPITEVCRQAVLPLVKRYVQTFSESVQTEFEAAYRPKPEVCTEDVSLLPETAIDRTKNIERAGGSARTGRHLQKPPVEQESERNLQYAGEEQPELKPEEQAAIKHLFLKMREYQNAFPHTKFGSDLVDPENKGDMAWARRVLGHVGTEMEGFCFDVGVKLGAHPNSLGKLPAPTHEPHRNPRERYIGLIVEWAADWKRGASERAERTRRDREAKERREALIQAANTRAKTQQEEHAKWTQAWDALPEDRKAMFRMQAGINLKADPQFGRSFKGMNAEQRGSVIEIKAKQLFREVEGVGGVS